MDEAGGVSGREAGERLAGEVDGFGDGEEGAGLELVGERAAVEAVHHEEDAPVEGFADVVDGDEVSWRMRARPGLRGA